MTDPLTWSINLGQWAGTRVRVHVLLLVFAADKLLEAAWVKDRPHPVTATLGWLGLLLVALALKSMAQAAMAARVGVDRDEVRIWPLGHLGGPGLTVAERSPEGVAVVLAGMAMGLALALVTAIGLAMARIPMVFNPFGNPGDRRARPFLPGGTAAEPFTPVWWVGWFGYLN